MFTEVKVRDQFFLCIFIVVSCIYVAMFSPPVNNAAAIVMK
jgi:hypothetical protein